VGLQNGNLAGPPPNAAVLLIGTNDLAAGRSPELAAPGPGRRRASHSFATSSGPTFRAHHTLIDSGHHRCRMAGIGVSLIAVRTGEGPLTEPTAATQPLRRQQLFMPEAVRKLLRSICAWKVLLDLVNLKTKMLPTAIRR
jgi:hypothetical protein